MKNAAYGIVWAISFGLATQTVGAEDPTLAHLSLVSKARSRLVSVYRVEKVLTYDANSTRETTSQIYEHLGDGRFRRRATTQARTRNHGEDWKSQAETLTVDDGRVRCITREVGGRSVVIRSSSSLTSPFEMLRKAFSESRLRFKGRESIMLHPCLVFELRSHRWANARATTYWIGVATGLVLKSVTKQKGHVLTEMEVSDVVLNVTVDDNMLECKSPEGSRAIDAGATERSGSGP